jgi:hypothetical protein
MLPTSIIDGVCRCRGLTQRALLAASVFSLPVERRQYHELSNGPDRTQRSMGSIQITLARRTLGRDS